MGLELSRNNTWRFTCGRTRCVLAGSPLCVVKTQTAWPAAKISSSSLRTVSVTLPGTSKKKSSELFFLFNIVAQKTERNERNEVCENTNWLQLMQILPCSLSSKEVHCRSLSISFRYSSLTHRGHCNKLYTEEPCAVLVALSKAYCQLIFLDSLTACYHCTWWFYSVSLYDALSWERYPPFTVPPCFETTLVLLLVTALPMLLQHRP